jgi:hypothetical protein
MFRGRRADITARNAMTDLFAILIFGPPTVFISMVISVIGIWKEKYWLVIIGALLFVPFSYYLNGAAHNSGFPLLLPLLQMGSAAAVHEKYKLWAWLLSLPVLLISLYVIVAVLFFQVR